MPESEGLEHLRRLIRIDTTDPPGNELAAARYLEAVLAREGIPSEIIEPVPGRAVLHARLRGSGARRPVLLTAHMDVVGVNRSEWTTDPFGGEVRDGAIYGRGAIDDKGMLAANLMAFLLLHRSVAAGDVLDRDIVFLATSDEESGGKYGMPWIIENHPRLIDAEFAINEGGRIRMLNGVPGYAAIQTAEKVPFVISMTASGPGGHASMPLPGAAIGRLARALAIVSDTRLPIVLSDTTRAFLSRLAPVWPQPDIAAAMRAITSGDERVVASGDATFAGIPTLDALLRHTLAPAIVTAGTRHNVIPPTATATLSLRMLPGHRPEDVIAHVAALIGDPAVTLAIESRGREAPASSMTSAMFRAMEAALTALDPNLVTVPYLSTGATESAYLRAAGVECYGILPFPLDDDDESRMHGADERLPLSAFDFGVRFLTDTLARMALVDPAIRRDRSAKSRR